MAEPVYPWWSVPLEQLLARLQCNSSNGLTEPDATQRDLLFASQKLAPRKKTRWAILIDQFNSPIIWLLFASAVLSFALNDQTNGAIILFILIASGLLGYWQEGSADEAVAKLLEGIENLSTVLRDGQEQQVPSHQVVPGDLLILKAGAVIAADSRLVESKDLFVDEAALTGESYPIEKSVDDLAEDTPLAKRTNALFLGTHVVSGLAKAVAVQIGRNTEFGRVSSRIEAQPPETGFEAGLRRFGNLLIKVTLCFAAVVFTVKVFLIPSQLSFIQNVIESLKFVLALAVGMTPQLLPAITSVVLAAGAKSMARQQVIVKRLVAIENLGGMNILCSDKTGTLTEGKVRLHSTPDVSGNDNQDVLRFASINSQLQAGFENPIDHAIRDHRPVDLQFVKKVSEIPYDFLRRRMSVFVQDDGKHLLITKGSLSKILEVCTTARQPNGENVPIESVIDSIQQRYHEHSDQGFRVLGVAIREITLSHASKSDESQMTFVGSLVLYDPPKPDVIDTVRELERLGVELKIITGDNRAVTMAVSRQVGLNHPKLMTGEDIAKSTDDQLAQSARDVTLFSEVEPNQKERIILALKKSGNIVGYLGDGINDAPALHAADVGISVDTAVDVAREAAQIVLLKQDLSVLIHGVEEGRRTLANTLKYVFFSISANFGYMFSMATALLFLPFLPLLPGQILLVNLLADFPAMALSTDRVDPEMIKRPRRWDIGSVLRFMLVFGLSSSLFDFATFGVLLGVYRANETEFRTGWFIESVFTGLTMMILIRTQKPFFRSRPGSHLLVTALITALVTLWLPFSPVSTTLGFAPPPVTLLLLVVVIAMTYGAAMETAKRFFYRTPSS